LGPSGWDPAVRAPAVRVTSYKKENSGNIGKYGVISPPGIITVGQAEKSPPGIITVGQAEKSPPGIITVGQAEKSPA